MVYPTQISKSAPSSTSTWRTSRRSASPVLRPGPLSAAVSLEGSPTSAASFETNPYIDVPPGRFPALPRNSQRFQQLLLQWVDLQQSQLSPTPRTTDQQISRLSRENLLAERPIELLSPAGRPRGEFACETMSGKVLGGQGNGLSDIWQQLNRWTNGPLRIPTLMTLRNLKSRNVSRVPPLVSMLRII